MGFYEELSRYYDGIFPAAPGDMDFTASLLAGAKRVLDLGCGTGNKTALLAAEGRSILALDSDAAMIARAREAHAGPGLVYEVMDMLQAPARLEAASFDAVLCLGNTLVHLEGPDSVSDFLAGLRPLLRPGGLFFAQILNYDRILDRKAFSLPKLESDEALFYREYEAQGKSLRFITTLVRKSDNASFYGETPLYPLRRAELEQALREADYTDLAWYGNYGGGPLTDDSMPLLVSCRS